MFSTVKSCKLLVFLGLALCLLLPGAPAFADTPMPPSQESSTTDKWQFVYSTY